ncbi:MAG TPA: hypothetical protein PLF21_06265 [Exilispira sp.]|nr:hypothetical protein [Exilispira sp.]
MENLINTIFKNIISFPYTPYIAFIILATTFIFFLPFINLITTISKVSKLFDEKNYTEVIRKVEKYFKYHRYEKNLLSFLYDSYLKLNNKQKALHYMQVAVEKGFIKDKYLKMFHNTKMAQLLYDLNQTTESFEKLYEVHKEGEYEASWCHLMGKIFLSQKQFENAIYYLERALFISKKSTDIYFDYTLALSFKLKERSLTNAIEIFIKKAKKEAIFIIAYCFIFKKDFSNAKLWLTKASFSDNETYEFYRRFLILFCSYNSLIKSNENIKNSNDNMPFENNRGFNNNKIFDNSENFDENNFDNNSKNNISKDYEKFEQFVKNEKNNIKDKVIIDFSKLNAEKTEFLLALNNVLRSDILESIKTIILENSIYLLKIINDQQNLNHFLITAKTSYSLFQNLDEEEIFSESKVENFIKRIQQGLILLDIFDYSIKKSLIPPADYIKKEFERLKPTASQTEQLRKTILSQYLRLTDRGFVKVNLRIVRLFEYIPTKIRSTFLHDKGISSLRILATEIEYPHRLALFIFRRTNTYDLSYKLFEIIDKDLSEQNIETCYFFYNFPLDPDAEKYVQDFTRITVYDQAHLALFLEESIKNK